MKKTTPEPSLRDKEIAYRTSEAKRLNLHPKAVEMARKQLSVPMPVVELYSQHEKALDFHVDDTLRDKALRQVFASVIYWARFGALPDRHQPVVPHTDTQENYAVEGANSSREDAPEAA
jgi:hypothetical protein